METLRAEFGVNPITYAAFKGNKNLKEAYFRIVKTVRDRRFLFKNCSFLEFLEIVGNFDKFKKITFSGADVLEFLSLWTHMDSLYFPPDEFQVTPCLKESIVSGTFEQIVEKRNCLPKDIVIKGYFNSTPLKVLSFYFESEVIA